MPKYSGPRMPSGRYYSKRKAGRPKGSKNKPKAKRGGLNKTEVKQTRAIAKRVINSNAESKYFDVRTIDQLSGSGGVGIVPTPARLAYTQLYVQGFAVGENTIGGTALTYGQTVIEPINHGRIHPSGNSDNQNLEGQYAMPSLSITTFDIQRVIQTSDLTLDLARNQTPFMVRVLRLVPRPQKGSSQGLDPANDAFVNESNQETGVADSGFEHYQLLFLKANSKKYQVKQDFRMVLNPPLSTTEVAMQGNAGSTAYSVANISNNFHRQMTFKHDIGKKLFYDNPQSRSHPTDGFKNEFILFHIIPLGTANDGGILPTSVRIAAKAVSTFKDF
ncbi:putative capsid protein [Avon-Heathcote Estuary associated circular virus 8]|uniref:putative capsid protein n=1 Tax=Avon-Heathcote Estuary associated circular virus 8 TaxID=1618259 RepID=UPI0005CD8FF4|nr:putative capsid protein [Avon-Heathcote Estuary associated circular virus 8]AJP36375.1 putative capsid protein [Avon-Heathcote Estuary associated circular virus 8]AJP36378.1 putative capsid protein [Avon-Heathcote Estuary associated circular virus 8]AJP36379.1 putative capsid protein [Avon-Heathcote Estuary associated circular virus 8]